MRIKKLLYYAFLVITFLASGCNSDEDFNRDQITVKFSSSVSGYGQVKASGSTWDMKDAIGIYMIESGYTPILSKVLADTQILRNKFRRLKGQRINPLALMTA
ncbi:MAG: hypothetical protein LBU84_05505 [Prevotella sp.]|jgi:hypothetical protein|nr:hypothetical protein [Prevotella sp.]